MGRTETGDESSARKMRRKVPTSIESLDADILCIIFSFLDLFDLVHCTVVCNSWNAVIKRLKLLQASCRKMHHLGSDSPSSSTSLDRPAEIDVEDFAMKHHKMALLRGRIEIERWEAHSHRVSQCRMKKGLLLTGVGDKVMRLWSLKSYKCMEEYSLPDASSLIDFDFDESKIVGLVGTRISIWRRNGQRSIFPSRAGTFPKGLCMRYIDPEAVVGCEDGTARVFDMYSKTCSQIIRTQGGPITCLSLSDNQLFLSGSSLGRVTVSDPLMDQPVATLKSMRETMGDAAIRTVVEAIHSSPTQAVVYLCGGASLALGWLMSVPGASNTLLESVVPYSRVSMVQLLGRVPSQHCSQALAKEMALLAYNRALKLSKPGYPVLGVGFTGSLVTSRPKRGDHRFFLSMRASDRILESSVTLTKNLRSREEEDKVSSCALIQAMAKACQVSGTLDSGLTESEVPYESETHFTEEQELEQLINGHLCCKIYPFSGEAHGSDEDRKIILPGSFNPLHEGHLKLLEVAMSVCGGGYPCFEISAINADKPPLTIAQIKDRVKQFEVVGKTIIVSNQPYFYKKAELFPGSSFVIGADTAARLVNPKYYEGSIKRMLEILGDCKRTGCTFLVGGRNVDGVFKVLEDVDIPEEIIDMFISIPADIFRMDISSTEIRKKQGGGTN